MAAVAPSKGGGGGTAIAAAICALVVGFGVGIGVGYSIGDEGSSSLSCQDAAKDAAFEAQLGAKTAQLIAENVHQAQTKSKELTESSRKLNFASLPPDDELIEMGEALRTIAALQAEVATLNAQASACILTRRSNISSTMLDVLTGSRVIGLSSSGTGGISDYCASLIEFSELNEAEQNTELFGNSDPVSNGATSSDARVTALMRSMGGMSGKGTGKGTGKGAGKGSGGVGGGGAGGGGPGGGGAGGGGAIG